LKGSAFSLKGTRLQLAHKPEGGGGFNPHIIPAERTRALAPEGDFIQTGHCLAGVFVDSEA